MTDARTGAVEEVTWVVQDAVDVPLTLGCIEAALTALNPEEKSMTVFLWRAARRAIVLGSACRLAAEVDAAGCEARDVAIHRRISGGGTVLLGPEVYCYSFFFSSAVAPPAIHDAFAWVHDVVIHGLSTFGINARSVPVSDIAAAGRDGAGDRKLAGHAQKRTRRGVLCEGCLMAAPFDFPIEEVLKTPPRQPPYRQGRTHKDFITNLKEAGAAVDFAAFAAQIEASVEARAGSAAMRSLALNNFPEALEAQGRQLALDRYDAPEWTARL